MTGVAHGKKRKCEYGEHSADGDDEPELLNEAPYEQFIAAIEVSEINDAELLTAEEYEKFLAE